MELNIKGIIIILNLLVNCLAKKIIKREEITTTEIINTYTIDDDYNYDNVTDLSTEYYNESITVAPLYNDTNKLNKFYPDESRNFDFCTCDLQPFICDLNCCCDPDCSDEDKAVFQYCEIEPRQYDTSYCDYIKYIYINNTRFQWEVNQNGLFCVIKKNTPPTYIIQRKHPLKSFEESETERINKFSWPEYNRDVENNKIEDQFVFGTQIWYIDMKGIHKFGIPNSFVSRHCVIKEPALYLKHLHTSCTQVDLTEQNNQLSLNYYIKNIKFLANPNQYNFTKYNDKFFMECPKNNCLSVITKLCDISFNNCTGIQRNDSRLSVQCNLSIKDKSNSCTNIVRKMQYIFYHNGTQGITEVVILAVLQNVTYEFGGFVPEMTQDFYIKFLWTKTLETIEKFSGNPGYLIGKPILTGTLLTKMNGSDTTLKIERNFSDYINIFLTIPKNINGDCVLKTLEYLNVEFGYNVLTKCQFRKSIHRYKKGNNNGTEICRYLQNAIIRQWHVDNNLMIGTYGNAKSKNLDDWIRVLYKKSPINILNNTLGTYSAKNNSLFCKNIVRSLQINIFHSRIDIGSLVNQEKILGVTFEFGDFKNYSLIFRKNDSYTMFATQLQTKVNFYDLTIKKEKRSVDPPSLEIKLPYDFFYPFIRVNNAGNCIFRNYFTLSNLFIVTIFFY